MNTNTSSSPDAALLAAIEKLKRDWPQLADLDRARAIAGIRKSGVPIRSIARALECSESSLRHLLKALQAPAADLAAARNGEFSTNELVRRGKAEVQRRAKKAQQAAEREGERRGNEGAKLICAWLQKNNVNGPDAETIINLVRDKFILAWSTNTPLPKIQIPAGRSAAELIELYKPKRPIPDNAENINWYVDWLVWWVLYVFTDPNVRIKRSTPRSNGNGKGKAEEPCTPLLLAAPPSPATATHLPPHAAHFRPTNVLPS